MIKYASLAVLGILAFQSAGVWAQGEITKSDQENNFVSIYKVGKISKLTITKALEKSSYDPNEDCSDFKLTRSRAGYFLKHSKNIPKVAFSHDYTYTSCSSDGTVIFSNGDEGSWTIYRYGRGMLLLTNGKAKGSLVYLHCKKCEDIDNK